MIAGVATLTVNSLSAGDQFITVIYSGDAVFSSSTSTISVAVTAPTNGSLDGNIQAVVDAQVQAGQRYMDTQIDNTFRRVEQLHDESDNLPPGIGLSGAPTGVGASGGSGSTGNDPAVIAGAHDGLPSVAVGPYGELSYPGEAALPTKKGPSAASQEISNLSSTLPSAIAALDAKGVLPFHIWASGSLQFGTEQADATYDNRFSTSGLTFGADGTLFPNFKGGMALGFGFDQTEVGTDGSSVKSTSVTATAYGSYQFARGSFLDVFVGGGELGLDTNRWSSQGDVMLNGSWSGAEAYGSVAVTHDLILDGVKASPYGRLDVTKLSLGGYTENGSSPWAIAYRSLDVASLSGVLGMRITWNEAMDWGLLTPLVRLEYRHDFLGGYDQSLYFASGAGSASYSIPSAAAEMDAYTAGLGLDAAMANGVGIAFEYDFSGSAVSRTQSLRFMVRRAF